MARDAQKLALSQHLGMPSESRNQTVRGCLQEPSRTEPLLLDMDAPCAWLAASGPTPQMRATYEAPMACPLANFGQSGMLSAALVTDRPNTNVPPHGLLRCALRCARAMPPSAAIDTASSVGRPDANLHLHTHFLPWLSLDMFPSEMCSLSKPAGMHNGTPSMPSMAPNLVAMMSLMRCSIAPKLPPRAPLWPTLALTSCAHDFQSSRASLLFWPWNPTTVSPNNTMPSALACTMAFLITESVPTSDAVSTDTHFESTRVVTRKSRWLKS